MSEFNPAKHRPKCLNCGRPLRKQTHYMKLAKDDPDPSHYENGRPVLQITKRYERDYRHDRYVNVWLGDYGDYGDNVFCGITCGYWWARKQLKK